MVLPRATSHGRAVRASSSAGSRLQGLHALPSPRAPPTSKHCSQLPNVDISTPQRQQAFTRVVPAATATAPGSAVLPNPSTNGRTADGKRRLRVLIAGAGIGGLVLAVSLLKQGFDVQVFERDVTAIRGEGKYRGPIQVQSNALAALEAIDSAVAEEVMRNGCITGDRINGLCDGVTGNWYVKFDTFHPAVDRGLPVTRVVSRVTLQEILSEAVLKYGGPDAIMGNSHVLSFEERTDKTTGAGSVAVTLEDGREFQGDMLVGADGIWSKIRTQLIGKTEPSYSEYTCYTGISDFTPADIDVVGYRVFLGNGQYFVSSDVGGGKMQWYAFHKEPAGGTDVDGTRKKRLLEIFGHWSDNTLDLIKATPEEDILRRDIYDRPPIFQWAKGRVALLGDSAHAMQPNLGQGGCMAIEDAYKLATDLSKAMAEAKGDVENMNVERVLKTYQNSRVIRVSTIHGMAGMAAIMASTYKAYLGEGLGEFGKLIQKLKIPHPGRVGGQVMMNLTMPSVLGWVLGGNVSQLAGSRNSHCKVNDKPRTFDESQFPVFMGSDSAITRAINADWLLVAERPSSSGTGDAESYSELKGVYINENDSFVGSSQANGCRLVANNTGVADKHARVFRDSNGDHFVQDLGSASGTWVNERKISAETPHRLQPGDIVEFGDSPAKEQYKVKLQHVSLRNDELQGHEYRSLLVGRKHDSQAQVLPRLATVA